jgi:DNA-binding Xre family transcriptional regulator
MSLSYNGLWKLLIDKNLNKVELMKVADISSGTVAKMTKGEPVSMTILMKICDKLDCDIGELVHYVRDEGTM